MFLSFVCRKISFSVIMFVQKTGKRVMWIDWYGIDCGILVKVLIEWFLRGDIKERKKRRIHTDTINKRTASRIHWVVQFQVNSKFYFIVPSFKCDKFEHRIFNFMEYNRMISALTYFVILLPNMIFYWKLYRHLSTFYMWLMIEDDSISYIYYNKILVKHKII